MGGIVNEQREFRLYVTRQRVLSFIEKFCNGGLCVTRFMTLMSFLSFLSELNYSFMGTEESDWKKMAGDTSL